MKKPLIVIGGPTACKKTDTAVELALLIGGEIVSADSMQVYKAMDVGTAKATPAERRGVPHYMIDELLPDEEFNIRIFQEKANKYIRQIYDKGKIPIITGGTGFYINSIVYDNDFMETYGDDEIRAALMKEAADHGPQSLHSRLKKIDPESAEKIHPNNVKRVIRAIEFHALTGTRISEHNKREKLRVSPYDTEIIVLYMPREALYRRINERVDKMMEAGLAEEVRRLLEMGYSPGLVSMQGLGYKEMVPYVMGETSLEEAAKGIKTGTRHFAKRQITWFKYQTDGYWIDVENETPKSAAEKIAAHLTEKGIRLRREQ